MTNYDRAAYGETWAAIYDHRHGASPADEGAVAFLAAVAGDGPALELAVGTGRIALPLAARGVEVHGVDSSTSMLDRLRAKPGADNLRLVEGDMATTRAARSDFSLVFVVANSLFLLLDGADQVACFQNAAAHLRPGGRFVVHAFVPDLSRFTDDRHFSTRAVEDEAVDLEASTHDPVAQVVRSQLMRVTGEGIEVLPVTVRYSWPSELDLMAALAGMDLESRFGDFDRQPFTRWSPFHVSIYRKPA